MDNITHSLTGLALARGGLNRFSPHATLLLVLSANAPDVDIVVLSRGGLAYLEAHRGYTHSLLCLPILAFFCVLVTATIVRERLPWRNAWLLCCVGIASHLLMDWTNSYGIRLLLPFSSRWSHLDWNSLTDIYILAALVLAAVWPIFARLVSREIGARPGRGQAISISALAFFVLFDGARATLHNRAIAQLESRLYNDAPPIRTAALPGAGNPLRWAGIVETAVAYRVLDVNSLGPLDLEDSTPFYKPPLTPALERAKSTDAFRYFSYFARFPAWALDVVTVNGRPGTRVELTDLRFGAPGRGSFHCIALEDSRQRVLEWWFLYGAGRDLGWGDGSPAGNTR